MEEDEKLPRDLSDVERELLLWILPEDRAGYKAYRILVEGWKVTAKGRRGDGNFILSPSGVTIDNASPLPQVLAFGVVDTDRGEVSVALRERMDNQLEFEVVGPERFPGLGTEKRRWTYSTWLPGRPCPNCGESVRSVPMATEEGPCAVLAICSKDRRLWVHDPMSGVNHLIPLTNFYNELMITKNIRDSEIALRSGRFFSDHTAYSDAVLIEAFARYNALRTKVGVRVIVRKKERPSWFRRVFSRETHE